VFKCRSYKPYRLKHFYTPTLQHYKMPSTYFDLPDKLSQYETAHVAILPVPLDLTTSYMKGTGLAPEAILEASAQVELYDEELETETCDVGIASLAPLEIQGLSLEKALKKIGPAISLIIKDGKLPIMIGGEHSITPPAVKTVAAVYQNLTVVQFDAHADLREEYDGTKWSHACAMARVLEICPAVQIGIRNLSLPEAKRVSTEKLPVFFSHRIHSDKNWAQNAIDAVKTDNVYVTVDVDVFDSSILPDTGTPEPGGLNWYDVTGFLSTLSERKNIVAFDFVELCPQKGHHASDFLVAKLIYKCIGYWAKKLESRSKKQEA